MVVDASFAYIVNLLDMNGEARLYTCSDRLRPGLQKA